MKKSIIISSVAVMSIGLMAFGFTNWSNSSEESILSCNEKGNHPYKIIDTKDKVYTPFFYQMGTRFEPISKRDLQKATSLRDFLTKEELRQIETYKSVEIIVVENERQTDIRENGTSQEFNASQIKLLRSLDYSAGFTILTEYIGTNEKTRKREDKFFGPHLSVVPEKQAVYLPGNRAFTESLSGMNKELTVNIENLKLKPAILYFTVTKKGNVSNIRLNQSCGITGIDNNVIEMITNMSGKWTPAENEKGQKMDQEMHVMYAMDGC